MSRPRSTRMVACSVSSRSRQRRRVRATARLAVRVRSDRTCRCRRHRCVWGGSVSPVPAEDPWGPFSEAASVSMLVIVTCQRTPIFRGAAKQRLTRALAAAALLAVTCGACSERRAGTVASHHPRRWWQRPRWTFRRSSSYSQKTRPRCCAPQSRPLNLGHRQPRTSRHRCSTCAVRRSGWVRVSD